jgi:hypothetical protein
MVIQPKRKRKKEALKHTANEETEHNRYEHTYLNTRMTGHQRLNSLHQLDRVDLGTITRCGPLHFLNSCK